MRAQRRAALERYVLNGSPLPPRPVLDAANLAAYAYTQLASDDESREELWLAYAKAAARHLHHRTTLLPLVRAWQRAGIESLLFKGFPLAEFVYASVGQRHYSDVDVLLDPRRWSEAERIAVAHGWTVIWARERSLYANSHEEGIITRNGVVVEVHRLIVHSGSPHDQHQRRVTDAAWAASEPRKWEDT
ncbi:MAG: nucleotidyltransferase family protein, partial [Gemmatimonadaceae bacterium]|nr:nucleotidyltransferase family protein [Gemmatimonadaceae bacterium]